MGKTHRHNGYYKTHTKGGKVMYKKRPKHYHKRFHHIIKKTDTSRRDALPKKTARKERRMFS